MIQVRPSEQRGHVHLNWLDSRHTFSFDQYFDPQYIGFGPLRVINEDVIAPGGGFGTHPHKDMEILTYVVDGALEHRDDTGSVALILPGDVQHMTAGTGVVHSEVNASAKDPVHLLQVWIEPNQKGLTPSYEQHTYLPKHLKGAFNQVAGKDAPVHIHQDANMYAARLQRGEEAPFYIKDHRHAWVQIVRGRIDLNGVELKEGDGAAVTAEHVIVCRAKEEAEVLLFDLP